MNIPKDTLEMFEKCMNTYDPYCQACKEESETMIHMFQCNNEDYKQWQK